MSSYCKQCSLDLFGEDPGQFAFLSTPEDTEAGRFNSVKCEGCGVTEVDHDGKCVSPDCSKHHGNS